MRAPFEENWLDISSQKVREAERPTKTTIDIVKENENLKLIVKEKDMQLYQLKRDLEEAKR